MEGNIVDSLLQLQEIDSQILEKQTRLQALSEETAALARELAALEKEAVVLRAKVDEAEVELRQSERTVQAGRTTLKRLQARAQEVHNMREHAAARAEVDASRQNLEAAEDQMLDAMQVQETARAALLDLEGDNASRVEEYRQRTEELQSECGSLEEEIALAPLVDGVCGHCFTAIPLQTQQVIRAGRVLVVCETCGVILHETR
jgi:predicted  nucleic acid-binding Zn-ribbon protein